MSGAYGEAIRKSGRQLMLSNHTLEVYADKATPRQAEFLLGLFDCELAFRDANKRRRLRRKAAFPVVKGFGDYDWAEVTLPKSITQEAIMDCSFIKCQENIICYGSVGTGKTHLAIAIGGAACDLGMRVRFITASELVLKLVAAKENGHLDKVLCDFASNDLTIIDEWGYVPVDREGSRLLFQVVSRCYESKSLMLTTNLEFSRWGSVLTEEQMAAAMIDRLLHHGHVITFTGESYRIRHAIMKMGGGNDE
jgi:DNA replication protein DnaC